MSVEWRHQINKDGEVQGFYCKLCRQVLSEEFYSRDGVHSLLGVYNCKHYTWVFVGDSFLDPPWDEETRQIIDSAIAKARADDGKYFLLPRRLAEKYS